MNAVTIALVPYYFTYNTDVERPYCLNYTNTSGELAVTRFTYNNRGLNDKAFFQQITGRRSSRNIHEFDNKDRMIRKIREYNDGETSEELFVYDKLGKLIEESFVSSDGPGGKAFYKYDSVGNAVEMICEGYKGWLEGTIRFDFDKDGKRLAGRILKDGEAAGTIEYKYNKQGNLIHEHWDIGNGQWSQTLRYVYEPVNAI